MNKSRNISSLAGVGKVNKIAFCPKCNKQLAINGNRGEKITVNCNKCGIKGVVKI